MVVVTAAAIAVVVEVVTVAKNSTNSGRSRSRIRSRNSDNINATICNIIRRRMSREKLRPGTLQADQLKSNQLSQVLGY